MSFISLTAGKTHKETKARKLKDFPSGYVGKFYRNLANNIDGAVTSDFYGRIANEADIPSSDVQKYLLATSNFAKGMQNDINHYVTRDRLNNASFRQKLDPIAKNVFLQQNPLELVFEDIPTFDAQNSVVGSLLQELDIGKKDLARKPIKKAPRPGIDLDLQKRLEALRKDNKKFNNNNNNVASLPLPSPPTFNNFIPPPPQPPQPSFNSFQTKFQAPPPPPPSSHSSPLPWQIPRSRPTATQNQPTTHFREMTMTKTKSEKEQILEDIDSAIYEVPEPPKIEIGDPLLTVLSTDVEDILADDYVNPKELQDRTIEQLKEEYKFDEIKDAFDEGKIPPQVEYFLEATIISFY